MPPVPRGLARAAVALVLLGWTACSTTASKPRPQKSSMPAGTVAGVALRATAVAALRQPVTTTQLGLAVLWQRPRELIQANLPGVFMRTTAIAEVAGTPAFERLLDREDIRRAEPGTLAWYVDGARFFPELDRQIAAASDSIRLQFYIFDNDDVAVRYADKLKRRSEQVTVQVLFDDLGSTMAHLAAPRAPRPRGFTPPDDMGVYLRTHSKVQARRILTPWLAGDHTKLVVFDKRSAMLGGMNIGREYRSEWHDVMVRVEGPVVASLLREFQTAWNKAGPLGDFALLRQPEFLRPRARVRPGEIPVRVLRTDPAQARHDILSAMLLGIRGARQRVWVETPYFSNDHVAHALEAAARRGVDVRVVLPHKGDSPLMDASNLATARGLLAAGAKIYRYPGMNHTKAMICDGWATFGSANLDTLSLRINRELNIAFSHEGAVDELARRVFLPDFQRSKRLYHIPDSPLVHALAESVADQL